MNPKSDRVIDSAGDRSDELPAATSPNLHVVRMSNEEMMRILSGEIDYWRAELGDMFEPTDEDVDQLVDVFSRQIIPELFDNHQLDNVELISYIILRFSRFFKRIDYDKFPQYFRALIGEMEPFTQELIADHIDNYFLDMDQTEESPDDTLARVLLSFMSEDDLAHLCQNLLEPHEDGE